MCNNKQYIKIGRITIKSSSIYFLIYNITEIYYGCGVLPGFG